MRGFSEILRLGFADGLIWFPFVLGIGLLYTHFKVIDVSIDGTAVMSAIGCAWVWTRTGSYSLSLGGAVLVGLAGYTVMWSLITQLRVNAILAGVIYSLIMHALSVILIGESIVLTGTKVFSSFLAVSPLPILAALLTAGSSEFFYRSNIGTTTRLVGGASVPNPRYNPKALTWIGFCLTGAIVGIGAGVYAHQQGVARAGGGFEFLVTCLASFLVVDRLIEVASSATNRMREKSQASSNLSMPRYWAHVVVHSVAFKALVGSVLFQILVLIVISKTPNPSYWKLFLGIALLLSVAKLKLAKRNASTTEFAEKPAEGVMLSNITVAYELGYEKRTVFDGMSLKFAPGINFVWGPNGSGKSSLLGLINGTISGQAGHLLINGRDVTHLPAHRRSTYLLTQNPIRSIGEELSVYENVIAVNGHSGSKLTLTTPGAVLRSLDRRLAKLGLAKLINGNDRTWLQEAGKLSGGQLQRLALQMALFSGADVILADEPTSGLDKENLKMLLSVFQRLALSGKTLVITTHDNRLCDSHGHHYRIETGKISPASMGTTLFEC
jgi:ABC-type lipoprotein export system ATPase subunit/ABC-type uncharacterized transport system permease subunit